MDDPVQPSPSHMNTQKHTPGQIRLPKLAETLRAIVPVNVKSSICGGLLQRQLPCSNYVSQIRRRGY
jgi:hypothetical protein